MEGFAAFVICLFAVAACIPSAAQQFDVLITNGRIVDGSGNPWFRADLGIRDGRIVAIGALDQSAAVQTIDAHDSIVSPGFIDMMGGESLPLVLDRTSAASKLLEGVTTMLVGEGESPAPQNSETMSRLQQHKNLTFTWTNYAEYFDILTQQKIALNVVHNVGAAQVREIVMGDHDTVPTPTQMEQMQQLVAEAMQQGCVGISTALIYPPGSYAKTAEIVALATVAAQYGGVYFSHIRNESSGLLDAIQEAIQIGQQAHIPVHIYHLKAAGQENWNLVPKALDVIEEARRRGIDVTADTYPYTYNGIGLSSFIAPWHFAEGRKAFLDTLSDPDVRSSLKREIETRADWENWYLHVGRDWGNVLLADVPQGVDPKYGGMSIAQIAELRKVDAWTAFFDLVQSGNVTVDPKSMNEEQKREIYSKNFVSVSSDAPPTDPATAAHTHPRALGTFPRILAKYVRDEHVMTLPDAIRAMTSLPAAQLRLNDRGHIALGMAADIVIFDPEKVQDTATYAQPASYPVGIEYVFVNGKLAAENGKLTNVLAGEVIRHHH
jgi:N-acyl-D-aspartate/D-glutamate deacylase